MEDNKLYNRTPRVADGILVIQLGHLALLFVIVFGYTHWFGMTLLGLLLTGIVCWRIYRKRPFRGPAVVELGREQLIFRDPIFVPAKVKSFALSEIALFKVVGPVNQRQIRVVKKDGSPVEVSRQLGSRDTRAILAFLRSRLPSINIVEDEPPGTLSAIRGDF